MRTIPRAVAAIVGGWILGSVSAIPFGLLILLIDHKAAGEKGVTIPNVAQEVAIGFLTCRLDPLMRFDFRIDCLDRLLEFRSSEA